MATAYSERVSGGARMKKKKKEDVVLVHSTLTFECDNHHEITATYHAVQKPSAVKLLQETVFHLECSQCVWKGDRLGSQTTLPRLAEPSSGTH
jgi:hypothetical protein